MARALVEKKEYSTQKKPDAYNLIIVDGNPLSDGNERVNRETKPLPIAIQQHHEELTFDIARITTHDIVLEMPWLKQHNSEVDWNTRVLRFARCDHAIHIQSTHRQRSMIDERTSRNLIASSELAFSQKNNLTEFDSTGTGRSQSSHKVRVSEENCESSENSELSNKAKKSLKHILRIYNSWEHLFQEEATAEALSKHQSWNHEIKLESGKQFTFELIYALFKKKLEVLREYLAENEKKEFIKKSQSQAGYLILFVSKKDETLRLCVDYRKLNNITIKNRYPLSNISELQDRLFGAKYFIKLNLREAYNQIRMKAGEEWKTAFRTRYELYEYTMMPFGLTNASATCQKMINDTLRQHLNRFVIAYLDDIMIYSKTLKEHVSHVSKVLECLNMRNLHLKSKKCEFHQKKVDFLEFVVERHEVRMDPKKLRAVKE